MSVGLAGWVQGTVRVPVMLVVNVRMRVRDRLLHVLVLMALGQVQPHARRHESASDGELNRERLSKCDYRHRAAEKRCGRKVCTGTRRPEMPQCDDEECQAHAIS